jgi:UPF0716 protein FxsA
MWPAGGVSAYDHDVVGKLLLLFIAVPAVELALLIEVGSRIGTLNTLALIALTGIIGAALARRQGLGLLRAIERDLGDGRLPAAPLVDAVIVLVAGALLITPGILTDAVGFALLVPATRTAIRRGLRRWLERRLRRGRLHVRLYPRSG